MNAEGVRCLERLFKFPGERAVGVLCRENQRGLRGLLQCDEPPSPHLSSRVFPAVSAILVSFVIWWWWWGGAVKQVLGSAQEARPGEWLFLLLSFSLQGKPAISGVSSALRSPGLEDGSMRNEVVLPFLAQFFCYFPPLYCCSLLRGLLSFSRAIFICGYLCSCSSEGN